ncbi:hypothetical protein JCM19045_4090 [Bacillus sp. JCM 19045]|nr:hypothetical protein JCM19045_4090 [Bacillus sp. JCM 19045]
MNKKSLKTIGILLFKWVLTILIFSGSFVYAMFQGGFVSWFLFYGLALVFLSSCFIPLLSVLGLRAERTLSSTEVEAGDTIEVVIKLSKPRLIPFFYYELIDYVPNAILTEKSSAMIFFSFDKEIAFTYQAKPSKRGVYAFDQTVIYANDLFGLFWVKRTVNVSTNLLVYPPYHFIENTENLYAFSKLAKRLNKGNDDHSISGTRQYAPGDRLTRIDWKRSANLNGLLTKEFETEENDELSVIHFTPANRSNHMDHWYEKSVEDVASLCATLIQKKAQLSLYVYNNKWTHVHVDEHSWMRALRVFALAQPVGNKQDQLPIVQEENKGVFIVVTAYVTEQYLDLLKHFVQRKMDVYAVVARDLSTDELKELRQLGVTYFGQTQSNSDRGYSNHA